MYLSRRVLLAVACALGTSTAPYAWQTQVTTVHVDNYGATPDDPSDDDAPAIRAALNFAEALSGDVTLRFAAGTYHLKDAGSSLWFLNVGSYTPDSLTITGTGTTNIVLVDDGTYTATNTWYRNGFLNASGCTDLTIQNLAVDALLDTTAHPLAQGAPALGTQGTIEVVNSTSLEVRIDDGYGPPITPPALPGDFPQKYSQFRVYTPAGNLRAGVVNRIYVGIEYDSMTGLYTFHHPSAVSDSVQAFDRIVIPTPQNGAPMFRLERITGLRVANVDVHASSTIALFSVGCTDVEFEDAAVTPGPAPLETISPPTSALARQFSSNRDGIHISASRGDVSVENCAVRNNGDDGIHVHGRTYTVVDDVVGSTVVTVKANLPNGLNEPLSMDQDTLKLYDDVTYLNPEVTISSWTYDATAEEYTLTLSAPLTLNEGDELQRIDGPDDSISILGNTCEQNHGRGVMIKSGDALISNNTTRYTRGPGIALLSVLGYVEGTKAKAEGGFATDVDIIGNTVEHPTLAEAMDDVFRGGIAVHHRVGAPTYMSPTLFANLSIRLNTIRNAHGPSMLISNATNVTVARNIFDFPDAQGSGPAQMPNGVNIDAIVTVTWVDSILYAFNVVKNYGTPPPTALAEADVSNATYDRAFLFQ